MSHEIAKAPAHIPVDTLLSQAIDKGVTVDVMERLVALREKMVAEEAKQAFNAAMAAFQAECPVIKKTKVVKTNAGQEAYRYAPIESIVEQVQHVIEKHGFRYSTTMQLDQNRGLVKVLCRVVHKLGHEEASEMEVPLGNKTAIMSQSQMVAAASTFAKRYAFLNAFGIMTGDEDNDAKPEPAKPAQRPAPSAPKPVAAKAPAGPAKPVQPKQKPTVTQVMEYLNDCKTAERADAVFDQAMKYTWTADETKAIGECRESVKKRIAEEEMARNERAGMAAA